MKTHRPYLTQPERDLRKKLVCDAHNRSLETIPETQFTPVLEYDREFPELKVELKSKGYDLLTDNKDFN